MSCGNNNCTCNQGSSGNQDNSRRDFLLKGLMGGIGAAFLTGCSGNDKTKPVSGEKVKVLTTDGKLVEVDSTYISHDHGISVGNAESRKGIAGKKFVMVIDLAKCDGCGECTRACQKMHFIPPDREWIKVHTMQDSEKSAPYYFPKPCFQCDNPPCTKVCPVDATFKRQDGIVLIDNERCIGCRFCMAACPYSVRFFNWENPIETTEEKSISYSPEQGFPRKVGTVEKCDFCPHLMRDGKLPSCVASCAMGAIYMGDENEDAVTNSAGETVQLSKLLEDNAAYRYLEELGTKPRVYYLPPKNRRYPKPEINKEKEGEKKHHDHKSM